MAEIDWEKGSMTPPAGGSKQVDWESGAITPPVEKPKGPGAIRKAGDLAVGLVGGAVGATKALTDVAGAGNAASNFLDSANKDIDSLLSPQAQADKQEQAAIMKEAEGKGTYEGVKAGLKAFAVAPVQTTMSGLGSVIPVAAATMATGGGAIPAMAAGAATGAAMGAGTVKGAIYDDIKERSLAAGMTPEAAEAAASKAQSYGGGNTEQIALGAGLGMLDAATGVTPIVANMARKAVGREAVQALTTNTGKGLLRRTATGALEEIPLEAAQGGQEQLATNLAAQRAGYDAGTWDNVASNATLEGLASAGPGAAFGALGPGQSAAKPQPTPKPAEADEAGKNETLGLGYNPMAGTHTVFPDGSVVLNSESSNGAKTVRDMQRENRLENAANPFFGDPEPVKPSEAMGLAPTAGPSLANAAILSVDAGIHQAAAEEADPLNTPLTALGLELSKTNQRLRQEADALGLDTEGLHGDAARMTDGKPHEDYLMAANDQLRKAMKAAKEIPDEGQRSGSDDPAPGGEAKGPDAQAGKAPAGNAAGPVGAGAVRPSPDRVGEYGQRPARTDGGNLPGAVASQSEAPKFSLDHFEWNPKKLSDAYSMEQLNTLYKEVQDQFSNKVVGGGPVDERGMATKEPLNPVGAKMHDSLKKAIGIVYEKNKAAGGATNAATQQATPQAPSATQPAGGLPAAGSAPVQAAGMKGGFDPVAFDKERDDRIKASKAAGNKHLDDLPAYVESMRGKSVYYAHDPKVVGVVRTVDNHGNVYVNWSDDYSAQKELASPVKDGKKTVMQTSLGPRDLKDYVVGSPPKQPAKPKGAPANVPQPAQPGTQASQAPSTQGASQAVGGTSAPVGTVAPPSPEKQKALDRIASGKAWFGNAVKAQEFISKNGLKDTHKVIKSEDGKRWDVAAKTVAETQASTPEETGKDVATSAAQDAGALSPSLSAKLQEAHKALGRDVTRPQVKAMRDRIANEVDTGRTNNGGVVATLTPLAIKQRQSQLARLDADLALFDEAKTTQPQGATREPQAQETVTPESRSEAPAAAAAVPGASNRPTTWRTNFMSAGVVASSVGINHKGKSLKALVSEIDAHDEQARQASTAPRRLEIGDVLMVGGKEYVINELLGSQVMAQRAVGADGKRVMVARFSEAHALSIRRQRPQEQPAAAGPVAAGEALQSAMGAAGWSAEVAGSGNTIWTKRAKKDRYTAILTPESNSMEITVLVDTVDTQIASFKVADPKDAAIAANKAVSDDVADSVPAVANPKIKAALDKKKGLGGRLAELNAELERQGAVQNANTRAQRDAIRKQIAEQDFPEILKAVDDNIDTAEELNRAFQYAGDEPKAKTIERILKKRGITPEYQKRWSERLMEGQQAGTKPESVVKVPEAIGTAIQEQMEKQKRRVMRRRSEESAPGLNLEQKAAAQTKTKAAEATLRAMRTSIFDAEDAAVKAIETGKASEFEKHADLFPAANDAILAMLGQNDELDAEMQAYEKKSDDQAMLNQMADMDAHPKYNDLDAATHGVTIAFLEDLLATVNAIKPKNPGEKSRLSDRVGYLTSAIAAKKNGASGLGSKAGSNFEAREKWWKGDLTLAGREMALEAAGLKTKYAPSNWSYLPDEVKVKLANLQDSGWVTPDTRKIVTPQIQAAAALDLMGFTKTPTGNGSFTLADSNMRVTVQPTGTGFQARMGSAESGPRLTEQQAIGWAAALRDESIRIQKDEAKGPPATPTAPRVIVNKLGADGLTDAERAAWKPSYADKPANEPTAEQIAAIGDITIEVPTETGTAKMTVNATKALASIDERLDALKMVQRCLA